MVVNSRFAVGISMLSLIVFPVVGRYWNRRRTFSSSSPLGLPLELRQYLSYFGRYKYFRFGWPYCYFRLSVVFEITVFVLATVAAPRSAVRKIRILSFLPRDAENCRCRQPHCRLTPAPQGTSANIHKNLIPPKTRVIGLHFCR